MTLRFGTDGVRGPADDLTDHLVTALGRAAARVLGGPSLVIGRDPRASGPRIERALVRGIAAEGVVPELTGVVPTPAVAWISQSRGIPGAVISASHNSYSDNGIKFFASGGVKLTDEVEERLEAVLDQLVQDADEVPASDASLVADADPTGWSRHLVDSLEGRRLDGMSMVIDCANGAASGFAPAVLSELGAHVEVLHAAPDGRNINAGCGSTHPEDLANAVVRSGTRMGLAFDGDADRVLAIDEKGDVVDGDHIIALCALDLRDRGRLASDAVVVTVMTNLGFRLAMADQGIDVIETAVGDRYVLEAMESGGFNLGGEQSGHVVFGDLATTGDGLLTGLQLADLVARSSRPLSVLAAQAMTRLPQTLHNVVVDRKGLDVAELIASDIAAARAELGSRGRVLVRPSGTEPLVRVMVEAETPELAESVAQRLASAVLEVGDH